MVTPSDIITPKKFVEILKRRVKKDWDAVVAITGEEGSSKSTLASWLVYEGCIYDGKTEEEALQKFEEYTIFSPSKDRVKKQITNSERYSVINADEAIKILYKQNWATPIQKFLNMFYALCRQENKISVLCMPRFLDFNEFFRNHRVKFWIHVLDRGIAVIFEKDWFPTSADPWFLRDAQKYNYMMYGTRRKTGDFNIEQKLFALTKLKNFIGIIKFDDLPDKVKKVYREGKAKYAYDDLENELKETAFPNVRVKEYTSRLTGAIQALKEKGASLSELAALFSVTERTIRRYLKVNRELDFESVDDELPLPNNSNSGEDDFL